MAKKRVSLKQLIAWAYRVQLVDVATGRTLADPDPEREPIHACSLDLPADSARRREAPPWRQGSAAEASAHPDAIALHDAVMRLPVTYAKWVIEYGRTGHHPEPCQPIPMPAPYIPGRSGFSPVPLRHGKPPAVTLEHGSMVPADRPASACWQGEWRQFAIGVSEVVQEKRQIYVRAGRGKMKLSHVERAAVPVEACRIEWWPGLDYAQFANRLAEHWAKAMKMLRENLGELREHEIAGDFTAL